MKKLQNRDYGDAYKDLCQIFVLYAFKVAVLTNLQFGSTEYQDFQSD